MRRSINDDARVGFEMDASCAESQCNAAPINIHRDATVIFPQDLEEPGDTAGILRGVRCATYIISLYQVRGGSATVN